MMDDSIKTYLLLVDDEADFRTAASKTLERRGFAVTQAASGEEALSIIERERFDIVVLDLKMEGMGGIETLQKIRQHNPSLKVLILTGHGDFDAAMSGIKLDIVDFLQKPVDVDQLAVRIRVLLKQEDHGPLREKTITELMASPSIYPRVYMDEPISAVLKAFRAAFRGSVHEGSQTGQTRSVLVYDRSQDFQGIIRFNDILKLLLPNYLEQSYYASYFTGMFLAQCKVFGNNTINDLLGNLIIVTPLTPVMEAVHLMVNHHLINLPVIDKGKLVGVIRERDVIFEIESCLGAL
jgi:DNA-binding response OmpR family regulator